MQCLLALSICFFAAITATAQDADHQALIDQLSATKVYNENSVTMSPDRDLLDGFKAWGEGGLKHLRTRLEDESRDVRHQSLLLLAKLPGGNEMLLEILKDKSSSSRGSILRMVGYSLRDPQFIPAAGDLIHSEDEELAIQAIGVTGRTHYLKVASDLVQILHSDNQQRSVAAAYALATMGVPDGATILVRNAKETVDIPLWQGKVIDQLRQSGSPDGLDYLLELFESGMKMTKKDDEPAGMVFSGPEHKEMLTGKAPKGAGIMLTGRSASAIAAIGHRSAMPVLQQGLKHPNKYVRNAALNGLTAGDPTAGKALLEALDKAGKKEVGQILYAIAKTNDKSLVQNLKKYLDGSTRDDAIAAMAMLGSKDVLAGAIEISNASDMRSKQMGVIAVAALAADSAKARERLMQLFDDPSPRIQPAAFQWVSINDPNPAIESAILNWVSEKQDPNQITYAARALAKVGSAASMDFLKSLAKSKAAYVRYNAALARQAISGDQQTFIRDNGEEVEIVLTSYYANARRSRMATDKAKEKP